MRIFRFLLYFVLLSFLCLSCSSSSSDDQADAKLSCSPEKIEVPANGGTYQVMVVASTGGWTASAQSGDAITGDGANAGSQSWLKVSTANSNKATGNITITVNDNSTSQARTGIVVVKLANKQVNINITQAGRTVTPIEDEDIVAPEGYQLVWNDEFNKGTELNSKDWRHEIKGAGWVNNELQTYVNGSANGKRVTEVADGRLYIHCFKGSDGKIYSARVYAHENEGWKYGVVEARIKLPKGKGTWPAFWMMPANNDYTANPWPKCGEIDIMEEVGVDANKTSSTLHMQAYNHTKNNQKTAEQFTAGAEDDFHVYRLEWTKDYIKTYVDGKQLLSFDNDKKGNVDTWPYDKPFYVILNLAWGGDWGGYAGVDEKALPVTMEVDYVRVFQKK